MLYEEKAVTNVVSTCSPTPFVCTCILYKGDKIKINEFERSYINLTL